MDKDLVHILADNPNYTIAYIVGAGIAFALILIFLGERLATRSLAPVILAALFGAAAWPAVAVVAIVIGIFRFRRVRRVAKVRYRHIVRILLRRKARMRRAGERLYHESAARFAARTASTRGPVVATGVAGIATSPLTRYCSRCRKNVPITATYCTRCGRKMTA
jgi:hypothetical protein